ncbi:MAG: RNA polymerase sigma factor [Myxococcota bacterium]
MARPDGASLEALMERYVDGDARAFDALYQMLRGPVRSALLRWLRTEDRVEDAFQVTVTKLHHSRERYRRGAPVLPWALTIARNVALDQLRQRRERDRPLEPGEVERIPDDRESPEAGADEEAELIEAVRAAVDELPRATREVVRLHKLEGKAMAEIAEMLGIKEGAVRVRAHRGYKALAQRLMGFWGARG